jgi:hypothetical protein
VPGPYRQHPLEKAGVAWDVVRVSPERQARKALRT